MHDRYGPIVRINPFELHIRDSQFFDTLYVTTKRDKWPWDIVDGMEGSVFTTVPHDIHRVRRSAVDQFFSTQNVRKLQPVIQELADKAVKRLIEKRGISEVFDAGAVFSAYSNGKCFSDDFVQLFLMRSCRCGHGICIWKIRETSRRRRF